MEQKEVIIMTETFENIEYGNERHDPFTNEMLIDGQMPPIKKPKQEENMTTSIGPGIPTTRDVFIGEIGQYA